MPHNLAENAALEMTNAMTVDVEDYFQVSAFAKHVRRDDWDDYPCRVERNVSLILELFERHDARATFFLLGWIAERYPELVRRIAACGHEIASHGFAHIRATEQTPAEFRQDVECTKVLLEDIAGCEVQGFRAASFSIDSSNLWALEVLQEAGYRYSSSVYPVRHDHYGMPSAPRFPFSNGNGGVLEIPITTARFLNRNLPCGVGGYFRLFPYAVTRWAFRRVNDREGRPGVFFFHPWELDPAQPRPANLGFKTRFRHYVNMRRMEARLERLLGDFKWRAMEEVFFEDDVESAGSLPPT